VTSVSVCRLGKAEKRQQQKQQQQQQRWAVGGHRTGQPVRFFFYGGAPLFFCNFAPVHATRSVSLFCCGFFAVAAFIHKNQVVKKEQQRKNDSDFIYLCQFADALPLQFVFIVLH